MRVLCLCGGGQVKAFRTLFHIRSFRSHLIKAQGIRQPRWSTAVEPCHMFAADYRDYLAKAFLVQGNQCCAMAILFLGHIVK